MQPITIKSLFRVSLPIFALLAGVVWIFFPGFEPCSEGNFWCLAAYGVTLSGGKAGTLCMILLTCFIHTLTFTREKMKLHIFLRSFLVIAVTLIALASANEYLIKPSLKMARPSHAFMLSHSSSTATLDSVYQLSTVQRRNFFQHLLHVDSLNYRQIDQRVLDHWVEEAGYSFPSGHSFNAFLLATFLAFTMIQSSAATMRKLYFVPFVWAFFVALSRVTLGAHSAFDVVGGAAIGLSVSHILLSIPATRKFYFPENGSGS